MTAETTFALLVAALFVAIIVYGELVIRREQRRERDRRRRLNIIEGPWRRGGRR